jgi:hypothetical protein
VGVEEPLLDALSEVRRGVLSDGQYLVPNIISGFFESRRTNWGSPLSESLHIQSKGPVFFHVQRSFGIRCIRFLIVRSDKIPTETLLKSHSSFAFYFSQSILGTNTYCPHFSKYSVNCHSGRIGPIMFVKSLHEGTTTSNFLSFCRLFIYLVLLLLLSYT